MKRFFTATMLLLILVSISFSQDDQSSRTLMKRTLFFVKTDGTVHKADYWSVPMGLYNFTIKREFPGEGEVSVEVGANLNFISSGYIEGVGASERGKIVVRPDFRVQDGDTLRPITLGEIDYIYMGGKRVKLKEADEQDLFIVIEAGTGKIKPKKLGINIYWLDPDWGELQHKEDIAPILAISFSKEGAERAWAAAKKAAGL